MKAALFFAGLFIAAFTYVFITTVLVYNSDIPEVHYKYPLGATEMKILMYSIILVLPAHFLLIRRAYKKHNFEFAILVPYYIAPYMLGATAQALFL